MSGYTVGSTVGRLTLRGANIPHGLQGVWVRETNPPRSPSGRGAATGVGRDSLLDSTKGWSLVEIIPWWITVAVGVSAALVVASSGLGIAWLISRLRCPR